MHPTLTIFCAFTRRWALTTWLENLAAVDHDPALTNLCIIVDIDDPYIIKAFQAFVDKHGYRSFHWLLNHDWHPNEVRIGVRRQRVAYVKNQSKELIAKTDGEIIISFEDDTVFDRLQNFESLYTLLIDSPEVGFVEGVQMGRWGVNIIGAWLADSNLEPTTIKTLLPQPNQTEQLITGGGFYGYATRRDLYLDHDYYTSSNQPWGPDVNYGFWLNQKGYDCLIDWSVIFGHSDHNIVMYPDQLPPKQRLAQVVYTKDPNTRKWNRTDREVGRY